MNRPRSIPQGRLMQLWITTPLICVAIYSLFTPLGALARTTVATSTPFLSTASFDYDPITSLKANPTINGSATTTGPLSFTLTTLKGVVMYQDLSVLVAGGRFAETVYPPVANGTYALSLASGGHVLATTTLTVGLRTVPSIDLDPTLPGYDVADGHLMRFRVHANGQSSVGIAQLAFSIIPSSVDVEDIQLYGFSDSGYSHSIVPGDTASTTSPLNSTLAELSATSSSVVIVPDEPIEVPAGDTYYFDLMGTVTPSDVTYDVETTLLGDHNAHFAEYADLAPTSNLVWSPDTYGTSSLNNLDWVNASLVTGVPEEGLIEVRSSPPPTDGPSCSITTSTSTAAAGTPVTLTWNTSNSTSAVWSGGVADALFGSKTYTLGSTTHTYILSVSGPYGQSNCFATVAVPGTSSVGAPVIPVDGFTATPTTGNVTFSTTFTGSVNNNKVCSAQTFTLGYGDGTASSTITVPVNTCKAVAFTLSHNYTTVGTFTAGLYRSTGTTTSQRIQTQVITSKAKLAFGGNGIGNVANALTAVGGNIARMWQLIFRLFGR